MNREQRINLYTLIAVLLATVVLLIGGVAFLTSQGMSVGDSTLYMVAACLIGLYSIYGTTRPHMLLTIMASVVLINLSTMPLIFRVAATVGYVFLVPFSRWLFLWIEKK